MLSRPTCSERRDGKQLNPQSQLFFEVDTESQIKTRISYALINNFDMHSDYITQTILPKWTIEATTTASGRRVFNFISFPDPPRMVRLSAQRERKKRKFSNERLGHLFQTFLVVYPKGGAYLIFPKSSPDIVTFLTHYLCVNTTISCFLLS